MFCKKCGSVLARGLKKCISCDAEVEAVTEDKELRKEKKPQAWEEQDLKAAEIIKKECPKCGNMTATLIKQGTWSDEADDEIYHCTKCGYGWRWSD